MKYKNRPGKFLPYIYLINYYLYFFHYKMKVPFRHVSSLKSALDLKSILEKHGVEAYLYGGALLGSVRQNGFAGRPKDVDFIIKFEQLKKLKLALPDMAKKNFIIERVKFLKGIINIIPPKGCPLSLIIYGRDSKEVSDSYQRLYLPLKESEIDFLNQYYPLCEYDYSSFPFSWKRNSYYGIFANLSPYTKKTIYGFEFNVPTNYMDLIVGQYGDNWMQPTAAQYS